MPEKIYKDPQDRGKLYDVWYKVGTHWIEEPEGVIPKGFGAIPSRRLHVAASRRIEGGLYLSISSKSIHLTPEQADDLVTILAFIKKVNDEYES